MTEKAIEIKNFILFALAVVGSFLAEQLGGWDYTLQVLLGTMVADYITGILVAAVFKRSKKSETGALSSSAGFIGICKKCTILILVWLGTMLDHATNGDFARRTVCLFFIANEGLSILENAGLMGVKYPRFMHNMLEALREKNEDEKTDSKQDK